jgi:group II intron reverse transcriptase/maturase
MRSVAGTKSFDVAKREVWNAYKRVKANRGGAGIDGVTIAAFEENLSKNLYRIWNRMASGSYFPPPIKRVEIPKGDGRTRPLGIPTVADRIAQMVVQQRLEPVLEPIFHADSYGYRPGRSAHDALRVVRQRCWRQDWVLDIDIEGFFDNIDHELLMTAVHHHMGDHWVALYVKRWLTADVVLPDGQRQVRDRGTPQGGVISPLLANLFLHYAFDNWMERYHPSVAFARYADDIVCHCESEAQATALRSELDARLRACRLALHPQKTQVVYCADSNRHAPAAVKRFDFLGYTFKPRKAVNRSGKIFISFSPAVGDKAEKVLRQQIRRWGLQRQSRYSLEQVLARIRPVVVGWVRYYGLFHPSALERALRTLDLHLARWAQRKYKRLRGHVTRAWQWLQAIKQRHPALFPHWGAAIRSTGR